MIGRLLLKSLRRPKLGLLAGIAPKRRARRNAVRSALLQHAQGLLLTRASQKSSLKAAVNQVRSLALQQRATQAHVKGLIRNSIVAKLI